MKRFSFTFSAEQLIPYVDWSYFFHAWDIKRRDYASVEAQKLRRDAIALMQKEGCSRGLFVLCDAHSDGEDIIIEGERFPFLRQQHCDPARPNLCLSDFISPTADKIGLFAASCDIRIEADNDPYKQLLTQTVADRLSEAAASLMHKIIRTDANIWGYSPNEQLTIEEINLEKYQGIRPAVGYPSLPDQSIIFLIDKLLKLEEIKISLTAGGMMLPHASVCGMIFAHPAAHYFNVGSISGEQLQHYAQRRGLSVETIEKFLARNIAK